MFTATGTIVAPFQHLKRITLAALLTLALIAGVGVTANQVAAQPVGPGLDSFSAACGNLQSQAQGLADEYSSVGRANPYDPRLDDILAQLRGVGTTWQQIGCQAVFGNILLTAQPSTNNLHVNVGAVAGNALLPDNAAPSGPSHSANLGAVAGNARFTAAP